MPKLTKKQKQEVINHLKHTDCYFRIHHSGFLFNVHNMKNIAMSVHYRDEYKLGYVREYVTVKDLISPTRTATDMSTFTKGEISKEWFFRHVQFDNNSSLFENFLFKVYVMLHGINWTSLKQANGKWGGRKEVKSFIKRNPKFKIGNSMYGQDTQTSVLVNPDDSEFIAVSPADLIKLIPFIEDAIDNNEQSNTFSL